jgi:hypothetical protein
MEDEVAVEISGLLGLPGTRGRCYLIALSRYWPTEKTEEIGAKIGKEGSRQRRKGVQN